MEILYGSKSQLSLQSNKHFLKKAAIYNNFQKKYTLENDNNIRRKL